MPAGMEVRKALRQEPDKYPPEKQVSTRKTSIHLEKLSAALTGKGAKQYEINKEKARDRREE